MNDLEINKALALAIGYLPEHIRVQLGEVYIYRPKYDIDLIFDYIKCWYVFNHEDPTVILRIVKKFGLTMAKNTRSKKWFEANLCLGYFEDGHESYETAAALAVIELAKEGKL